jgi:cytochrome c oxidase subunit 2
MTREMLLAPRRLAIAVLALGALVGVLVATQALPFSRPAEKVIRITAQRFRYEPATVTLKRGEPVTLELRSVDVVHGFNLPDLKVRTDVPPGQTRRIRIVPDKIGQFSFHCDNFCGIGHEEMAGVLNVVD